MHMADALITPIVGGTLWAAATGTASYSINKLQNELDEKKIPLMGVIGAFVFASQMINFTIPATGSSGHIGGGMLLAILLGPYAGFLTMAAVLAIQALFFADGGLLALGCNIINMGFFTCFIAYPLIYKKIMGKGYTKKKLAIASVLSAVIGLQFGAFGVVLETILSGKTELPFLTFVSLMQPIHLAIGLVEGLITAAVVTFIWEARPEIITNSLEGKKFTGLNLKKVMTVMVIGAILLGGVVSWFASSNPDGLEWAIFNTTGQEEITGTSIVHEVMSSIQEKTAILPDYSFKKSETAVDSIAAGGTSFSGIFGGALTLALAVIMGSAINMFKRKKRTT
ncbi:MAG: cobalamin biosynthesis protein CbiM [Eubacteriaceae bacterium]|nr:cobalamin biosynthesis protein CbiM [Eubacteriaceae bacterium]